ncbi:hypothetical protein [Microbaculum marinisediminis]|uniref:Uncharacterized protein n=1 Tax=Microbaculum marinisediminis TaxID=2931392 RepID=A0AAW5QTQ4_9HYPH|nr:hypothetical protein [Microbaculum sp. A6E488]MCT8970597.1 hypothetical protein [Microbaculum sp. A6E488]
MGCRCGERRKALRRAAEAIAKGDRKALGANVGYVGRTMVQDVRALARDAAARRLAVRGSRR